MRAGAERTAGAAYLKGALFGLAAASIWAGWSALTRFAVTGGLDAWDVAALRFGVAGILLLPVVVRRGLARDSVGWGGLCVLVLGAGVPYVLLAAGGLRFAPAHDQGALNPGFMPVFVALIAAAVLHEKPSGQARAGLALIVAGALVLVGWQDADWRLSRAGGHAMFLAASFLWAGFTVVMRRARLAPLHAAALVAVFSAALYLPFYAAWHGTRLLQLPVAELAVQSVFQGVFVTILSLLLYGRAVALLGAPGGAAFGALVPALSALFAIPLLGEWPAGFGWAAIAMISVGVYLASGGPLSAGRSRRPFQGRNRR